MNNKNKLKQGVIQTKKYKQLKTDISVQISKKDDVKKYKNRCKWCNLQNPIYIKYHDEEWGKLNFDEKYLFKMLILESFQAGLSWECVLNKRKDFEKAYDNFDINKICSYDTTKIKELLSNKKIIRNKLKINASVNNSKIFKKIQSEYGSFGEYLKTFTNGNFKRLETKRNEICRVNYNIFIFTSNWSYIFS